MRVITDPGNFLSLKLYVASSASGLEVSSSEILSCGHDVAASKNKTQYSYLEKNRLPLLEIAPGQVLFSPNVACSYLMKKGGKDIGSLETESWLEWESSQFQPVLFPFLVHAIGNGKKDSILEASVKSCLTFLETSLGKNEYFVQNVLTAADIVLWSSLYPLFCDNAPLSGAFSDFPNLSSWFRKLSESEDFKSGIEKVTGGKPPSSFKDSLLAQPLPLPGDACVKTTLKEMNTFGPQVQENSTDQEAHMVSAEEIVAAADAWTTRAKNGPKPRKQTHPKLPVPGERNILITSALPYVNNVPHLGNIIGCVLSADVFSRFCRYRNYNTLYICGTDEYGTATETKAMEEGLTPQQICDKYNAIHHDIYKWFNIDFDYFGRTTTKWQTEIAQDMFWKLYNNGYVLKDTVDQLKCLKCDRFLADRFVEGTCPLCGYDDARGDQCDKCGKLINAVELQNPRCKICGESPSIFSSKHLFLDLPKLVPELSDWHDKTLPVGLWTANAKLITRSWVRDGLKPRCITRDLRWGTPVPLEGFEDKVFYVWFDAPIGYLSITANYTDQWEKWWKNPDEVDCFNFMAKDNVPFHSVVFPCSQIGCRDNFTLVNHLIATEYLNYEDGKFSKSRGIGVFGNDARNTGIPADIWRFYLLYLRPETMDSTFSWDDFVLKNNSELLNNLGNFINRALMFCANSFEGVVPEVILKEDDKVLLAQINQELKKYIDNLEGVRLREGIKNILSISRLGNVYIQSNKPWVLVKGSQDERTRAGSVIGLGVHISCLLSSLLQPYMPDVCDTIRTQLNAPDDCSVIPEVFIPFLKKGHKIGKPSPLFQKIEPSKAEELKKKFAGTQQQRPVRQTSPAEKDKNSPVQTKGTVDQQKVDLLTAEVAQQGDIVRKLKTEKVDKLKIDVEVAKLLDLKRQLCIAQGQNPEAQSKSGKKKRGGKK